VLRRGETKQLRRDLACARARVADLEAELRDRNRLDPGTRLLSLDAFRADAEVALRRAAREGRPAAVAVVDIDGFRALNACHGTKAGDAALRAVAARLRRLVRADDLLGRTGADEIAVLMPATALAGAESCCERLSSALADARVPLAGAVTVSAGIAARGPGDSGATIDALLADAGAGVDLARAEGGARTAVRPDDDGVGGPGPLARHAERSSRRCPPRSSSATATPASTPSASSSSPATSRAPWASRRPTSSGSPPPRSCTTSARSRSPTACCTSPLRWTTTSGCSCATTPSSASASCARSPAWAPSRASSATSTSASTAAVTPTASPARRSRSAAASFSPATPITR
jgi:diguanylate cyclase (GGDEF)-like protein